MEPKSLQNGAFDLIGLQFAKLPPKDLEMSLQRELSGGLWGALGALWEHSDSLWAHKWRPRATKEDTKDLQDRFCGHLKNKCFTAETRCFWRSGSPRELQKWPRGRQSRPKWGPALVKYVQRTTREPQEPPRTYKDLPRNLWEMEREARYILELLCCCWNTNT